MVRRGCFSPGNLKTLERDRKPWKSFLRGFAPGVHSGPHSGFGVEGEDQMCWGHLEVVQAAVQPEGERSQQRGS